ARHTRDLHSFPTRRSSDLKRSRKGIGARASIAFLIEEDQAVFSMLDENHVRKTLVADLRDFPAAIDLFMLNVLGSQELFQVFQRSEEHTSELQSPYDLVCR